MAGNRRKPRDKGLTERYRTDQLGDEEANPQQRFSNRSKFAEANKIVRTAALRADEDAGEGDVAKLPVGEVVQVFSRYSNVRLGDTTYLCIVRKTLNKISATAIVVGDRVRFRDLGSVDEQGRPEAIIEDVLARETILTRPASFKGIDQAPIVANAQQMLIVASVLNPTVKWGLVDRMIIAAQSGKLRPIVCLNKIDLGDEAEGVLAHYQSLDVATLRTSVERSIGLDVLREMLRDKSTVLSGHSGVGKSSLIRSIQPKLDIRIGEVSEYTDKGRHTTTSARRYDLDFGGAVIDTPGVKQFGLWGVTKENLLEYFPDVAAGSAPTWRVENYQRIEASLT